MRSLYQELWARYPAVKEFTPAWHTEGPKLSLHRVPLDPAQCRPDPGFALADLILASPTMRDGETFAFRREPQWAGLKGCLEAGRYRLTLTTKPQARGSLMAAGFLGDPRIEVELRPDGTEFSLPRRDEYMLILSLVRGTRLKGLELERLD